LASEARTEFGERAQQRRLEDAGRDGDHTECPARRGRGHRQREAHDAALEAE